MQHFLPKLDLICLDISVIVIIYTINLPVKVEGIVIGKKFTQIY